MRPVHYARKFHHASSAQLQIAQTFAAENPDICIQDRWIVYHRKIVYIKRIEIELTERNRRYVYVCIDND